MPLTGLQEDQFYIFYQLLIRYNEEYDLTRLKTFEDIVIKHFIDSIYFTRLTEIPDSIVDIGTGAGFPGIPLKIFMPNLRIILAEPRFRRVKFMETVIAELGLDRVEIYPHKVTDKSYFDVNGVITRALESVNDTLDRVKHFLPGGGRVLFMKGPEADKDLNALAPSNSADYRVDRDLEYTLPQSSHRRRLLIFQKTSSTFEKKYHIFHDPSETIGIPIASADNRTYKTIKKLTSVEGVKKQGATIISGKKIVREILNNSDIKKEHLIIFDGYSEKNDNFNQIMMDYHERGKLIILKKALFNEIDLYKTESPLLTVRVPFVAEWDRQPSPGCTLMIPFQDPANVGTVIRSACAMGIKRMVMLQEAANPYHPRAVRSSSGTVFSAEIFRGPSIYDIDPESLCCPVMSLDSSGEPIEAASFPESFILIPGLEGPGLPEALRKNSFSLPLSDCVESLNAPIAATLAMYEWHVRGRKQKEAI